MINVVKQFELILTLLLLGPRKSNGYRHACLPHCGKQFHKMKRNKKKNNL